MYRTFISNHPILIFRTMQVRERHQNNNTVDGRNPAITAWDALNFENRGINYQPQLVNAGFLPLCHFPFSNQPGVFPVQKKKHNVLTQESRRGSFYKRPIDFDKICLGSKGHDAVGPLGARVEADGGFLGVKAASNGMGAKWMKLLLRRSQ